MKDEKKTKKQLIDELNELRGKLIEPAVESKGSRSRPDYLYPVLSKISEAIATIKEPAEFSREVCKIAVEDGQFRMAWIGRADAETGWIMPFARWGHEEGYLDNARISIDASIPEGRGPTGAAIREGTVFVCNDIENDPRMKPWRTEALKRGYRSSAAFPLRAGPRIVGVFSLYSEEPNFFNEQEIRLIKTLASSIYFAFDASEHEVLRKQASRELQRERDFVTRVLDTVPSLVIVLDADGRIVSFNRACENLSGYSYSEASNKPLWDFLLPPEEIEAFKKNFDRLKSGDYPNKYISHWLTKNGDMRLLEWQNTSTIREDGSVEHIVGTATDITERKAAEEELKRHRDNLEVLVRERTRALEESERKYRERFENSQVGMFRTRLDPPKLIDVNKKFAELLGYEQDELIGVSSLIIWPRPEDRANIIEVLKKKRILTDMEIPLISKKREIKTLLMTLQLSEEEGIIESSAIDITEKKRAEEEIRNLTQYRESILENASVWLSVFDERHNVVLWNRAAEEISGYLKNEVVGNARMWEWTFPDKKYRDEILTLMDAIIHKGDVLKDFDTRMRHKNGEERVISWNARNLLDEKGVPIGFIALGRDITREKQAEEAMRAAERNLEEQRARAILSDRLRSLGEMAAGIAHELNQPLLGVRGLAEHILIAFDRGWKISEDDLKERAKLIVDQADRMSHIIEHVRLYAREANSAETLAVQVNDVVNSCITMIGAQLKSRGITLECELRENLPNVRGNPFSLEEVVFNLISNARDALAEKERSSGKVPRIGLRTFETGQGRGKRVNIQVSDNGTGIPREILEKIFDPFFTTKGPEKGTGLGLAISKAIIEGFSGKIEVESNEGIGTTVTISLPPM